MLQEDGAHLSFGVAALGPMVPTVRAQSKWHRGPDGLRFSPSVESSPPTALAVQEDSPFSLSSITQVLQLEVSGHPAT